MLPQMVLIKQEQTVNHPVDNVADILNKSVRVTGFDTSVLEGKKVGIAVGSRGIHRIDEVVSAIVDLIHRAGGNPVIFAAMGSHGEGTAQGQREMLGSLGISEERIGAPVETCADAIRYGTTDLGIPVYGNPLALSYDAVILVNRIKMHTDFEDFTESGLLKLLAVGIGNPAGCKNIHSNALRFGYGQVIRSSAAVMLEKLPVAFGIMLTENWKHQLDHIEAVLPENFVQRETALLQAVKNQNIKLPVEDADVLVIQEIGKNISGAGMDTKVVGRLGIIGQKEPEKPDLKRIVLLELTEESHGNACGIGLADLAPISMLKNINIAATSLNSCSANTPEGGRLPCFMPSDQKAIQAALETVGLDDISKANFMFIQNTSLLEYIVVSQSLYEGRLCHLPHIQKIGEAFPLLFDNDGKLRIRWKHGKLVCEGI